MNGLPYYKAYPRDFLEGTVGMDFETKGAYRLVLDLIYMQGGHLPDDPRYIAGLLGCSVRKWNSIREKLLAAGKIYTDLGIISNFRADKELIISRTLQEKNAENRRGPNKNKDLQSRPSKHTEPDTDTYGVGGVRARTRERILEAIGLDHTGLTGHGGAMLGTMADMAEAERWVTDLGLTEDQIVAVVREVTAAMGRRGQGPPATFRYFTPAMQRAAGALAQGPLKPSAPSQQKGPTDETAAERAERVARQYRAKRGLDCGESGGAVVPLLPARRSD